MIESEIHRVMGSAFKTSASDPLFDSFQRMKSVLSLSGIPSLHPGKTLEEIAEALTEKVSKDTPYTRERARQLMKEGFERLSDWTNSNSTIKKEIPSLINAVFVIEKIAPCSVDKLSKQLKSEKIVKSKMADIDSLFALLDRFCVEHDFVITRFKGVSFVTRSEERHIPRDLHSQAVKHVIREGACSTVQLQTLVPKQVSQEKNPMLFKAEVLRNTEFVHDVIVSTHEDIVFLDSESEWFFFEDAGRNRLVTNIKKVFSVKPQISRVDLITAVDKGLKLGQFNNRSVPDDILISLAVLIGHCNVSMKNGSVAKLKSRKEFNTAECLSEAEKLIYDALHNNGSSNMEQLKESLERENESLSPAVLAQRLTHSPVISIKGRGIYEAIA